MIWLKSFARAITTAFEFGAMGGFLGAIVSGFWGMIPGFLVIAYEVFTYQLSVPTGFEISKTGFFAGAITGCACTGIVMCCYGFLYGWRPAKPDFYRPFRAVMWGGWLCLFAGGLTSVAVAGVWNLISGNGLGLSPILTREPYITLGVISCFFIGSATGAIVPSFVERYIQACDRIRNKRRIRQPLPMDQER